MQFINYVLRFHSSQELFIWTPTLFRRSLHTYIGFDTYPETVGLQILTCSLANRFCKLIFHYWNYWRNFIGHLNDKQYSKTSVLRYDQLARRWQVTMHCNGGLVEARHHHKHLVFSAQHTFATDYFLRMWHDSIKICILEIFGCKYYRKPSKCAWSYFILWQIRG